MSLIEEAIRNWEAFRAGVIAEIENTPEEHLDHRPGEGARTLREVVLHIVALGVGFTDQLLLPDGSFLNLFKPGVMEQVRAGLPKAESKAELVDLLRKTGEESAARLRAAGDALETQTMTGRYGPQSRLSLLWFAAAHEMYHRGQLAIYERSVGTVPALTKQIEAMRAGQGGKG
jgi:uncharacterized damage-inducible protein DinB